ncbi:MAG: D-arabinono-1,4-lactone oxidase [Actinomycetota bacterium]
MPTDRANWSDNFTFAAASFHQPRSVAEVQGIVARSDRVKAVGTRHSFVPVADSPGGALVDLSLLAPEVTITPDGRTASVTAGTSYGVLAQELERWGYALSNMASLPHISVGGGTATGTHGSSDRTGILATAISALELVTADGSLITVDRSDPDLAAMAVGLGAFGIMTRVHLDVEPSYRMRQDAYLNAPWDTVLASLDDVMASAYSVNLGGIFGTDTLRQILQKVRLDEDPPDAPPVFFGGTWTPDEELPPRPDAFPRGGIAGPWHERLPHFRPEGAPSLGGDELQSEYFVDRADGPAALEALRAIGHLIDPHLWGTEIRTTIADDLWLSPAYGRDTLCIGFTWRRHLTEVPALLPTVEEALLPFEVRPHWGKLFHMTDLASRFPRLSDFVNLAERYDPDGKFWSPFLDRLI